MVNKADRFYFENFVRASECSCKAAHYLEECLTEYRPERMQEMRKRLIASTLTAKGRFRG